MKAFMQFLVLCTFAVLISCSGNNKNSCSGTNAGWVTITTPTSATDYTVYDTYLITLAGESFISEYAEVRSSRSCNCSGLVDCSNKQADGTLVCSYTPYYDSGVTVTVTNHTTGESVSSRLTSIIDYTTNWSEMIHLVRNKNIIEVRSEDYGCNWASAQIVITSLDTQPPGVSTINPANNSIARVDSKIVVTFTEGMNTTTITSASFSIKDASGAINGLLTFSEDGRTATFTPQTSLAYDTLYSITLDSSITDSTGNPLPFATYSFTTESFQQSSPSGLTANVGNGQVTLNWDSVFQATSYNVYFGTDQNISPATGTSITGINTNSYTHTGLNNGTTYYYIVTAVNDIGQESLASYISSATSGIRIFNMQGTELDQYDAKDIAMDSSNNIYITQNSGTGPVISKLDSAGNILWVSPVYSDYNNSPTSIAIDVNNNIYIAGNNTDIFSSTDIFIAKYNSTGNRLWMKTMGQPERRDYAYSLAVDMQGNSYLTGSTESDLAGTGKPANYEDTFIAKYSSVGNLHWVKVFGSASSSTEENFGKGIAVDSNGNSYVTGYTYIDLDGTGIKGSADIFISKYDTSGTRQWIKQLGTAAYDSTMGIGVDANGNSYLAGITKGDLGGSGSAGNNDIFITSYDTSGNQLWINQYGTSSNEYAYDVSVDSNGNSYILGLTFGDLIGTGQATSSNTYIMKHDNTGAVTGTAQFASTSSLKIVHSETGPVYFTCFVSNGLCLGQLYP